MDRETHLIDLAVAQFTGFHHHRMNGDRVVDLVESMGLSKSEWKKVRPQIKWLNRLLIVEIDEYFKTMHQKRKG